MCRFQGSKKESETSSFCSFEGNDIICGGDGDEFDVTFWVSLVNKNHRYITEVFEGVNERFTFLNRIY